MARASPDYDINEDEFTKHFENLEANGMLVNIKPHEDRGSYHVCTEKANSNIIINKDTQTSEMNTSAMEKDDDDLISMIKNIMLDDKLKDKDMIQHLHAERKYLHQEITNKKPLITALLDLLKSDQNRNIEPIETSQRYVCSLFENGNYEKNVNRTVIKDDGNIYLQNVNDGMDTCITRESLPSNKIIEWNVLSNYSNNDNYF